MFNREQLIALWYIKKWSIRQPVNILFSKTIQGHGESLTVFSENRYTHPLFEKKIIFGNKTGRKYAKM